jgi:hypothetical protein
VFISSVSQYNLDKLKDLIWQAIHSWVRHFVSIFSLANSLLPQHKPTIP